MNPVLTFGGGRDLLHNLPPGGEKEKVEESAGQQLC